MSSDFRFTSGFRTNHVFIIDGLGASDYQTGKLLRDELLDFGYQNESIAITYLKACGAGELLNFLEDIHQAALHGCKPIIHFECHGSAEAGLSIGDGAEAVPWSVLEPWFRRINFACECNLGVVVAACYGLHAITPLKIYRPTPFYFLLGPQGLISAAACQREMSAFYKALFTTQNLDTALSHAPSCLQFHAERFFAVVFGKYLKRTCMGKKRLERVERSLSHLKWTNQIHNRGQLREARERLKERSKAESHGPAFSQHAKTFLAGRKCSFTFRELLNWVRSGRK